jgi:hypothetical protein
MFNGSDASGWKHPMKLLCLVIVTGARLSRLFDPRAGPNIKLDISYIA